MRVKSISCELSLKMANPNCPYKLPLNEEIDSGINIVRMKEVISATSTLHWAVNPPSIVVTSTKAVPMAWAVNRPSSETLTIPSSELLQVTRVSKASSGKKDKVS